MNEAGINLHRYNMPRYVDVHYSAIMVSINDCVFRRRGDSRWAAVVDLDEFIVVRQKTPYAIDQTLLQFLDRLQTLSSRPFASAVFRNAFFPRDWPRYVESASENRSSSLGRIADNITLLALVYRRARLWSQHDRSKSVVDPHRVRLAGNHFVFQIYCWWCLKEAAVVPEEALLHHYRRKEIDGKHIWNASDTGAFRLELGALPFARILSRQNAFIGR